MPSVRKLLVAVLAGAALTASASAPALAAPDRSASAEASAKAGFVECEFEGPASFNPGVRPIPLPITAKLRSGNRKCVDDTYEVRSASFEGTTQGLLSCFGSPGSNVGKGRITWKLDDLSTDTSTVEFRIGGTTLNDATLEGRITSGRYELEDFRAHVSFDLIDGAVKCLSPWGATEATFQGTFSVG